MPTVTVNGVRIFYDLTGGGDAPLGMVHGAWWSHRGWESVVPGLAKTHRVLTYDRRGHSASERPPGQGSVREDVGDLAELIEHLELAPAWVVGVSSGASIVLRLAAERPDLLRGVILHDPALFSLLADDPEAGPILDAVRERIGAVVERIVAGDHAAAARQFVETVAAGPGRWDELSDDYREILIDNAPSFLDDARDDEALAFDVESITDFSKPSLITVGEQSPPFYGRVASRVADAMPQVEVQVFPGAGHVPHRTHPEAWVETVTSFIRKSSGA